MSSSPVATEYNVALTLTLPTVAGIVASGVAIFRNRDAWRYFGMVTLALNLLAWRMTTLVSWAFNPPPGVDY